MFSFIASAALHVAIVGLLSPVVHSPPLISLQKPIRLRFIASIPRQSEQKSESTKAAIAPSYQEIPANQVMHTASSNTSAKVRSKTPKSDSPPLISLVKPATALPEETPINLKIPNHHSKQEFAIVNTASELSVTNRVGQANTVNPATDNLVTLSGDNISVLTAYDIDLLSRIRDNQYYPRAARSRRLEGRVTLFLAIESDGNLVEVLVRQSSGYEFLDRAAVDIVKRSAPFPAPRDYDLMRRNYLLPINFRLSSQVE